MSNLSIKLENDRIFKGGSFPEMHSETVDELPEPTAIQRSHYSVAENTVKETTIQSILRVLLMLAHLLSLYTTSQFRN